jgi:hypothetical protein
MRSLQREYVRIERDGKLSYGGNQMWAEDKTLQLCGCGPVAVLDTILYLTGKQEKPISLEEYNRELKKLSRAYLPLIRPFGINGILLAVGMNLLLRRYKLPYRAFWAVSGRKFWDRVEELLAQDLPVIFSVGPNFPAIWRKHRLTFYARRADGSYYPAASAKSHYITATGCDEEWLRISSWGREYYIRRQEYDEYIRKYSAYLVSNVLMLRKTS